MGVICCDITRVSLVVWMTESLLSTVAAAGYVLY